MGKAASKKEVVMLTNEMSVEEAEHLVTTGKVPLSAYTEWMAGKVKAAGYAGGGAKESPVTKKEFLDNAKSIVVTVDGQSFTLPPKLFGTGSLGWGHNWKQDVEIAGKVVKATVGINFTINNSKLAK